jgi:hypothetical protein
MAYWLKMVGASDRPLDNRWIETRPELLRQVRSPWRPSGIKRDDWLVYYASGIQCLFAIARATEDGSECQEHPKVGEERWPWLLHVQVGLAVPTLQQAPDWRALRISSSSVQQKSYIEISASQYDLAWQAITAKTRLTKRAF